MNIIKEIHDKRAIASIPTRILEPLDSDVGSDDGKTPLDQGFDYARVIKITDNWLDY